MDMIASEEHAQTDKAFYFLPMMGVNIFFFFFFNLGSHTASEVVLNRGYKPKPCEAQFSCSQGSAQFSCMLNWMKHNKTY